MKRIASFCAVASLLVSSAGYAANIIVNSTDNTTTPPPGQTNLWLAISLLQNGDTIQFNISGAGPHYLQTPSGGYPLITKHNVTIDGYSQPGAVRNSNTILAANNAQIKIVLTSTNGNYTSMDYSGGTNAFPGFDASELAVLGVFAATNVQIRGLSLLGNGSGYGVAVARGTATPANGLHVNGCWIGVAPNGTTVADFDDGIAAFSHRHEASYTFTGTNLAIPCSYRVTLNNRNPGVWESDRELINIFNATNTACPSATNATFIVNASGRYVHFNHVIGVKPGSLNPRAEFNVIVGGTIPIIMEGYGFRISGNFLGVMPDGVTQYLLPVAQPGQFAESFIEIGRGVSDVVIGTDGDGVNDAEERNVMGGVVTDGGGSSGSINRFGYRHNIEFYSASGALNATNGPGDDRQRIRVSGNYVGIGVDGVTRFTNGVPMLNGSSTAGTHFLIGSDFDGVSDAVEGNVFYGNFPGTPGYFYASGYTNSTRSGSGSHGFLDEPDPNAGGFSTRGNRIVNNYPYPFNPRRGEVPTNTPTFANLRTYINKALATAQPATEAGFYGLFPVISASSTTARLVGTAPANNATYPYLILDVYLPDPVGLTNGLVVPDPYLTNGWVHGRTYLGSFLDNGASDSDPAVGSFNFSIASLDLAIGAQITISANYSKDAPGTRNARVLTSLFAKPQTLGAGGPVVTVVDDGVSNIGANGTLYRALTNSNPGEMIAFNIPGNGPHYFKAPPGGFPLLYRKHNVTINGYTQPGSAVNTAPITATNNAVIKIVIDSRNGNFRDMAYVYYGKYEFTVTDPPIDNSSLFGDGGTSATGRERGGYDPAGGFTPADPTNSYAIGEKASLAIYRATNVTIRGLAFVSDGSGYSLAVAQDFGYDTSIRDRFTYDSGTSRGFHVAGCLFGTDPGTGAAAGAEAGIAAFRHRDRGGLTAATRRPSSMTDPNEDGVPNGEGGTIGVKAGSPNPRAEFNVFSGNGDYAVAAEFARIRVCGNQFDDLFETGRYHDTQVPSLLFGTDGDGVNDAEEGNLFLTGLSLYGTRGKVTVVAGNVFNLALDGTRPGIVFGAAFDEQNFSDGAMMRFGSDFNGVSDALEKNRVYDAAFSVNVGGNAPANGSWFSMRGNELVNCVTPPIAGSQLAFFDKFMDAAAVGSAKPVIAPASTVNLLTGTCPTNKPAFSRVFIDLYISDPEGDAVSDPQGKTYLATFEDNSPADANPAPGAFSFNISSLGLTAGTNVTIAATYHNASRPTISSMSVADGNVTLEITGGNPTYNIQQASSVTGPWSTISLLTPASLASPASIVVPTGGAMTFYRVGATSFAQQTSPFADKVNLN